MPTTAPKLKRDDSPPDKLIGTKMKPPKLDDIFDKVISTGSIILFCFIILLMLSKFGVKS
jgi:hypothetical protein